MLSDLEDVGELYQDDVADRIVRDFGSEFIYFNDNGNPAIRKDVLKEFRHITGNNVVWCRGDQYWRFRTESDDPGRAQ